ncbi:MAG: ABC transporter ATP-binding protein [Rhizobiaceae bacterium]|nr:ABC transporter ATP-binding protein [Rhizobiaceae bacterium]
MSRMVEVKDVSKSFDGTLAVNAVNLVLNRGEFLTIVGPSGCGKTTLLRMIAGFEVPSAGEIRINNERVENIPPYRRSIGMVFQKLALFPHMTAAQNVAYPLKMRRFEPAQIPSLVDKYLQLVQLGDYAGRYPHELSGGQQQRVAIARALSFSPDLLLLDEPLSALDKKLREEMQLEFRRIQQELGVTTINVTHDQREALVMSDRIAVMNEGVVQQDGTPVDMYRNPENRFVANFIGMTSLFEGTVCATGDGVVSVKSGNVLLQARSNDKVLPVNTKVDCAIRAEQIRIVEDASVYDNSVFGTIEHRIFEGDRIVYTVHVEDLGGARLHLFDHDPVSHKEYPANERVRLGWNARDLFAFQAPQSN